MPFSLSADLGFTRLFGASADLEFIPADGAVTLLELSLTLPGLQSALVLSTVNPATLVIALPGLQPALVLSTVNPAAKLVPTTVTVWLASFVVGDCGVNPVIVGAPVVGFSGVGGAGVSAALTVNDHGSDVAPDGLIARRR